MKTTTRFRSAALAAGLSAALFASTAISPVQAKEIDFSSDNALARALLPYAPWVFDLAVQSARNFAEVSYGRRGYDPVTASFTVNDLHISRDAVNVTIGQLRAGTNVLMLQGLDIDTRTLDLPPPLREALRRMGKDTVTGDVLVNVGFNAPRSAYDVTFRFDFPDIGALAMGATVDGFHVLVPLSDIESGTMANGPVVSGTLIAASVAYRDAGLVDTATGITADQSGVSADDLKAGMKVMPAAIASQILDGLPGGASQQLRETVLGWAKQAETFLEDKGAIRVTFDPVEPLPLAKLQTGLFDETLIAALNPTVVRRFDGDYGATDQPAGSLGAASALISGVGAPQDREAGARTLVGLAATGDLDAVAQIGSEFGNGPAPVLDTGGLTSLYSFLLVARALDDSVSDTAIGQIGAALPGDAVIAAERDAAAYFRKYTDAGKSDEPVTGATVAGYDADALRARAYALYEGRSVPRNLTEAYALALVAAAAGDPFAARLRDDLATAAQEKRIVLSLSDARTEAATLWTAFQGQPADKAAEEPAPQ